MLIVTGLGFLFVFCLFHFCCRLGYCFHASSVIYIKKKKEEEEEKKGKEEEENGKGR